MGATEARADAISEQNLTKALSQEFGPRGIRLNSVSPGPVATDFWLGPDGVAATVGKAMGVDAETARERIVAGMGGIPSGRFTTPEEVAALVVVLASERTTNVGSQLRGRRRSDQDHVSPAQSPTGWTPGGSLPFPEELSNIGPPQPKRLRSVHRTRRRFNPHQSRKLMRENRQPADAPELQRRATSPARDAAASADLDAASTPRSAVWSHQPVLALQAAIGNRSVAALISDGRLRGPAVQRMRRAAPAPPAGRYPKRRRREAPPRYFVNPQYGPVHKRRATWMTVTLGPTAHLLTNRGSHPGPQECWPVNALNKQRYRRMTWIKGHLLNEELGGPGVTRNLTPLSPMANSAHKNLVETPIKNAIDECERRSRLNDDPEDEDYDSHWYGVHYTATVVGDRYPQHPALSAAVKAIGRQLVCTAEYWAQDKATGVVDVAYFPPDELPDLPTGPQRIGCALP